MSDGWLDIHLPPEALAFLAPAFPEVPAVIEGGTVAGGFARFAGKAIPYVGTALLLYELYKHLSPDIPAGGPWWGPGWTVCCRRSSYPADFGEYVTSADGPGSACGFNCNHATPVLTFPYSATVKTSTNNFQTLRIKPTNFGYVTAEYTRAVNADVYPRARRLFRGHGTTEQVLADPADALNPNVARSVSGSARDGVNPSLAPYDAPWDDPWSHPSIGDLFDDFGKVIKGPAIRITVRPGPSIDTGVGRPAPTRARPRPGVVTGPGPVLGTAPAAGSGSGGTVVVTSPTHPRSPPRRTKERKVKSRGLRLFDIVSEAGDAVDCFYKALPKPTRKKWDKKQSRASKMGENFGQYGFGGADYKLPALYHNWHDVDLQKAMQCLVTNEIEDRIIGRIAGYSRGASFGVSQAFRNVKNFQRLGR